MNGGPASTIETPILNVSPGNAEAFSRRSTHSSSAQDLLAGVSLGSVPIGKLQCKPALPSIRTLANAKPTAIKVSGASTPSTSITPGISTSSRFRKMSFTLLSFASKTPPCRGSKILVSLSHQVDHTTAKRQPCQGCLQFVFLTKLMPPSPRHTNTHFVQPLQSRALLHVVSGMLCVP